MIKKLLFCLFLAIFTGQIVCAEVFAGRKIVVDKSGRGDFTTIGDALKSLDSSSAKERTIFIRNGLYNEKLLIKKSKILFEGESRTGTIITQSIARDIWRCSHPDDWGTATVNISADDISFKNLTIQNTFGFVQTESISLPCPLDSMREKIILTNGHQMALRTFSGTRFRAVNVHFKSFGGDTVSPWNVEEGMFYFKDCIMEGAVDLYCPRGWAYAENCIFIARSGSAILWHDGSANEDSKTVLKDCSFEGFDGFNLGRYHRDAQFFLINCNFANNMSDKDIFLVPTSNEIKWGRRVYYFNCHKKEGDQEWFTNNLNEAKGAPQASDINPSWVFNGKWDPEDPVN